MCSEVFAGELLAAAVAEDECGCGAGGVAVEPGEEAGFGVEDLRFAGRVAGGTGEIVGREGVRRGGFCTQAARRDGCQNELHGMRFPATHCKEPPSPWLIGISTAYPGAEIDMGTVSEAGILLVPQGFQSGVQRRGSVSSGGKTGLPVGEVARKCDSRRWLLRAKVNDAVEGDIDGAELSAVYSP